MADLTYAQIYDLVDAALGADGGCIYCVGPILRTYRRVFPDVNWAAAVRRRSRSKAYSAEEYIAAMESDDG